jgi:hypothetical protein
MPDLVTRGSSGVVRLGCHCPASSWADRRRARLPLRGRNIGPMKSEFSWRVLLIGAVLFAVAIATLLILVGLFAGGGAGDA